MSTKDRVDCSSSGHDLRGSSPIWKAIDPHTWHGGHCHRHFRHFRNIVACVGFFSGGGGGHWPPRARQSLFWNVCACMSVSVQVRIPPSLPWILITFQTLKSIVKWHMEIILLFSNWQGDSAYIFLWFVRTTLTICTTDTCYLGLHLK